MSEKELRRLEERLRKLHEAVAAAPRGSALRRQLQAERRELVQRYARADLRQERQGVCTEQRFPLIT